MPAVYCAFERLTFPCGGRGQLLEWAIQPTVPNAGVQLVRTPAPLRPRAFLAPLNYACLSGAHAASAGLHGPL